MLQSSGDYVYQKVSMFVFLVILTVSFSNAVCLSVCPNDSVTFFLFLIISFIQALRRQFSKLLSCSVINQGYNCTKSLPEQNVLVYRVEL